MKILVINPNTSVEMTQEIDVSAKKYAQPGTVVTTVSPEEGPRSIESHYEEALIAKGLLSRVIEGNLNNYDAIIIACFGDPHLDSAREISDCPVFGIAESAMHMACLLGYKFSIVTVFEKARPTFEELVRRVGLENKCASIKTTSLSVLDLEKNPQATIKELARAAKKAIEEDGAEVIVLGCGGMAGLDKPIEAEIGIPVLDGVVCAIKLAESVFDYKLKLSKVKAYMKPGRKEFVGLKEFEIK
jgi:allantoin racemase